MNDKRTVQEIAKMRCMEEKCGIRNYQCDQCRIIIDLLTTERRRADEKYHAGYSAAHKFAESRLQEAEKEVERLNNCNSLSCSYEERVNELEARLQAHKDTFVILRCFLEAFKKHRGEVSDKELSDLIGYIDDALTNLKEGEEGRGDK